MPSFATTVTDKFLWQKVSAFFSRLGGQAGLLRIGHSIRLRPQYSRAANKTTEFFSDGTGFTDGTGFVSGLLPPQVFMAASARRGDKSVTIGGLPVSLTAVLRPGDLLEFRPNGIADGVPRLHEVVVTGNTDSSGRTGVEIRPPLRAGLAAGDMVALDFPTSVFHLVDDTQADVEMTVPNHGTFGFQLIEAIENV
ncbi:hypothetical protein [Bradyrhizobium prioriisuperbiae]|uniref:hypothetical protein n=1 Tax=Bradyrhizobium prioriisuperbiae TaxID=2854389 RepID=UPI0028E7E2AF|nr:hypothetical protein [Bradyrhizobium prioritasuperba]